MYAFELDDGKLLWHEPEVYYKPNFIEDYHCNVYDPNFISYVGQINKFDIHYFMNKKGFTYDCVIKIRSEKHSTLKIKNIKL